MGVSYEGVQGREDKMVCAKIITDVKIAALHVCELHNKLCKLSDSKSYYKLYRRSGNFRVQKFSRNKFSHV